MPWVHSGVCPVVGRRADIYCKFAGWELCFVNFRIWHDPDHPEQLEFASASADVRERMSFNPHAVAPMMFLACVPTHFFVGYAPTCILGSFKHLGGASRKFVADFREPNICGRGH